MTGLLLRKQKHLLASVGNVPALLCFCPPSRVLLWAVSEQWTQKHFQACERREDSLELANKTRLDTPPQEEGEQEPKHPGEGAHPSGNPTEKVWRNCYVFGTKSFSGD